MNPIRLVIADHSPIFRKGLKHSIHSESRGSICIVGEADNGESLLVEVAKTQPDVVLTDIQMPMIGGLEASRIINEKFSSVLVLALTFNMDPNTIYKMYETGAKGYLAKTADIDEVIVAIKTVVSGEMYYCTTSSSSLIKKIESVKYSRHRKMESVEFTEREIQFIRLICSELTTKEIADKMKISTRTVEVYSQNVKEKIEARNLVGIALYAIRNNILWPHEI